MSQPFQRHRASVDAVRTPTTGAVLFTALATLFVPLTALVFVTYPAGGLAAATVAAVAYTGLRTARTRPHGHASRISRAAGKHPTIGETADSAVDEGAQ